MNSRRDFIYKLGVSLILPTLYGRSMISVPSFSNYLTYNKNDTLFFYYMISGEPKLLSVNPCPMVMSIY